MLGHFDIFRANQSFIETKEYEPKRDYSQAMEMFKMQTKVSRGWDEKLHLSKSLVFFYHAGAPVYQALMHIIIRSRAQAQANFP